MGKTPIESRREGQGWPGRYAKRVEQPNARQREVLERLAELGAERAELATRKAYMTTPGRIRLDAIYTELRRLLYAGHELGIGHAQMRELVGVNSTAYYKIKAGRTGR